MAQTRAAETASTSDAMEKDLGRWSTSESRNKSTSMALTRRSSRRMSESDLNAKLNDLDTLNPVHPKLGSCATACKVSRISARLWWWFCLPGVWMIQFGRLLLFVMLMMPGFLPPFCNYLTSKHIKKNIVYGPRYRHQLDVYLPLHASRGDQQKAPVVIFVSGGAWIIGYKAWAFIMGQLFQQFGVLFIAPDYRNFPDVTIGNMVADVIRAMDWIMENVEELGGDLDNITFMGQSAGAHLAALVLLDQAQQEAIERRTPAGTGEPIAIGQMQWSVERIARWVGISGPYDIISALPNMKKRGLPSGVVMALMEHNVCNFSPCRRIRDLRMRDPDGILDRLPPVYLFHGTSDKTCHWHSSRDFAQALQECDVHVHTKYYEGKSHTDPILEDPCEGPADELMTDLLQLVAPGAVPLDGTNGFWRLQPKLLLKLARICNPF